MLQEIKTDACEDMERTATDETREPTDEVGETLLLLISKTYPSDAAFERAAGLPQKTVSNWRRGKSTSYLKMLPTLAEKLGVSPSDLLTASRETRGLTLSEQELLRAFRETETLPDGEREDLKNTLLTIIRYRTGGRA